MYTVDLVLWGYPCCHNIIIRILLCGQILLPFTKLLLAFKSLDLSPLSFASSCMMISPNPVLSVPIFECISPSGCGHLWMTIAPVFEILRLTGPLLLYHHHWWMHDIPRHWTWFIFALILGCKRCCYDSGSLSLRHIQGFWCPSWNYLSSPPSS